MSLIGPASDISVVFRQFFSCNIANERMQQKKIKSTRFWLTEIRLETISLHKILQNDLFCYFYYIRIRCILHTSIFTSCSLRATIFSREGLFSWECKTRSTRGNLIFHVWIFGSEINQDFCSENFHRLSKNNRTKIF